MAINNTYETSAKVRITGALMANYVGKPATIVGDLQKVESDGKRATLKTTDDQYIQVLFSQPISRPLTPQLLTEVYGIVLNKNQFQCHRIMQFKAELTEKFDRNNYNDFVTEFVKNCDQHINCMVDDPEDDSLIVPIDNFALPEDMTSENTNTSADMSFSNSYF